MDIKSVINLFLQSAGIDGSPPPQHDLWRFGLGQLGVRSATSQGIHEAWPVTDAPGPLVVIGSGLGELWTANYARQHPDRQVYLVDKNGPREFIAEIDARQQMANATSNEIALRHNLSKEGLAALDTFYREEGIPNASYFQAELGKVSFPFSSPVASVAAWKAPEDLGSLVIDEADRLGAARFDVTSSAIDAQSPDSAAFTGIYRLFQEAGLPEYLAKSVVQRIADSSSDHAAPTYDYRDERQIVQGKSLKGLFALGLAQQATDRGYAATVTHLEPKDVRLARQHIGYNQPDFVVSGTR